MKKKILPLILCLAILVALFFVGRFLLRDKKQEGQDAMTTYLEVIDSLQSGEIAMTAATGGKASVLFCPLSDGKTALYAEANNAVSYYDGTGYYVGNKGEALEAVQNVNLDSAELKRYLLAGPDQAFDKDFYVQEESGVYKTFLGGYKLVIVTREDDSPYTTTLTAKLSGDKTLKEVSIVDSIVDIDGKTYTYKTVLTYSRLGETVTLPSVEKK